MLFVIGFAETAAVERGCSAGGVQVLTKPFTMQRLAARVKAIVEP